MNGRLSSRRRISTTPGSGAVALVIIACLIVPGAAVAAATHGILGGRVIDADSGAAVADAVISVEGTGFDAVSGGDGEFTIINLPAGAYAVTTRRHDHGEVRQPTVVIFAGLVTRLALELPAAGLVIAAPDSTALPSHVIPRLHSTAEVTATGLTQLPLRDYQAVMALQSGVTDFLPAAPLELISGDEGHASHRLLVRGGTPDQTGHFVDGTLQQDPFTGLSTVAVSHQAIDQVVLHKGGFGVAQGRLGAGLVQIITREGGGRHSGTFGIITDNLAGDWVGASATDYNIYTGTFSGPLPGSSRSTFFLSGERRWLGDSRPSAGTAEMAARARRTLGTATPTHADCLALDSLADDTLPANSLDSWSWLGKLRLGLWGGADLRLESSGVFEQRQLYQHAYLFDQAHTPRYKDRILGGSARYTHRIAPMTSIAATVRYQYIEHQRGDGVYFDELRDYTRSWWGNPGAGGFANLFYDVDDPSTPIVRSDAGVILEGDETHVYDDYLRRIATFTEASFAISHVPDRSRLLEFGGDYRRYTLRSYHHFFPVRLYDENLELHNTSDIDRYGFGVKGLGEYDDPLDGRKEPTELGLYAQGRVGRRNLVVQGGLRYDRFSAHTQIPVDPRRPLDGDPEHPEAIAGALDPTDLAGAPNHNRFALRLGASFSPARSTTVHLNAGQYYQIPVFSQLYSSLNFLEYKVQTGGYMLVAGNAGLEPRETIAYEVGVAQVLRDVVTLRVSACQRYRRFLTRVGNVPPLAQATMKYLAYVNADRTRYRGLEVDLAWRRRQRLATTLNYCISAARVKTTWPVSWRDIAWTTDVPMETVSLPTDYDQQHRLVLNLDYRFGSSDGPRWGNRRPWADFGVNLLFTLASGMPYTPISPMNEISLGYYLPNRTPLASTNSFRGPWTSRFDLKVDKGFELGGIDWEASVRVLNLLDRDNVIQVYNSSGSPTTTTFLSTQTGETVAEHPPEYSSADPIEFYKLREYDPTHFGLPRLVRFGLEGRF